MQTELASLVLVHEDDKENRTCHNLPKGCKTESKCVIQCHSPLEEDTNEALLLKAKYRWNY